METETKSTTNQEDHPMTITTDTQDTLTITEQQNVRLTPAQTDLLTAIADRNDHGEQPSKADLTRGMPNRTRADAYQRIGQLIKQHLVRNEGTGNAYRLVVTDAGQAVLAGATTVEVERTIPVESTWTVVDRIVDGAVFTSRPCSSLPEAEAQAAAHVDGRTEHLASVSIVESVRPKFHSLDPSALPEPVATVVWSL